MTVENPQQFRIFTRMSAGNLETILRLVGPLIAKTDTNMREAISAKERMAVTIGGRKSLISKANFFTSGLAVQLTFKYVSGLVIEATFFSQSANPLE